ncbi:MAG: zinc-binding dehydrogenase [Candidatus Thorarchaeota archaeon]
MKSLVLTRDGLQLADTPSPPLMPGHVRIEVRSVGISRVDLQIWKGELDVDLPLILGSQMSGVIHESSVPEFKPGVPVTSEIHITCGTCWYCKNRKNHLCRTKQTLGLTTDGAMAEYLCVPYEIVHKLTENIDSVTGTFVEPLANAIETFARATVEPEEKVLVLGTGKTGLLVAQVFDAFGADVYLVGENQWHLGVAKQLGLRNVINRTSDWKRKILDATSDIGPQVVVEATGTEVGLKMAMDIVKSGGKVALTGRGEDSFPLNRTSLIEREISLIGSIGGDFEMAIMMLDKGRIEVNRLVSKKFTLEQGNQAFEAATQKEVVKVNINI